MGSSRAPGGHSGTRDHGRHRARHAGEPGGDGRPRVSARRRRPGAGRGRIFLRHALRNSLVPVLTVLGLNLASLLGGAVATEFVFAWPGLGKALVRAIALRDVPVVEGCVLLLTGVYV